MSALSTSIQHCTGGPSQCKKQEEKRYTDFKRKVKLSLFTDDRVVYVKIPKESTKKATRTNK